MNIAFLEPLPTEKAQFHLSKYKFVPKKSGCYALTTFDGNILYIGLSENLYERFQQHLANPEKTNPTPNGKAIWFYYILFDIKELPKLERTWLNQFSAVHGVRPILNKADSPVA